VVTLKSVKPLSSQKMINNKILTFVFLTAALSSCNGQSDKSKKMENRSANPLLCDPATGVCEVPGEKFDIGNIDVKTDEKSVKVIYFTDPICSSCWGIEPQLRKLKLDWSYNSGGISKPSDVAHHWDEVSLYYDMPIDGDIWLQDPLDSSYPPSIAFKAAQMQDREKALDFMRELREMVFLKKKNIAKWEHIATAAQKVGLNTDQLKKDFEGRGKELFQEDLKLAREMGVRGFPTMFFTNNAGKREIVYGSKPYAFYETAVLRVNSDTKKSEYSKNWESLFEKFAYRKRIFRIIGNAKKRKRKIIK